MSARSARGCCSGSTDCIVVVWCREHLGPAAYETHVDTGGYNQWNTTCTIVYNKSPIKGLCLSFRGLVCWF